MPNRPFPFFSLVMRGNGRGAGEVAITRSLPTLSECSLTSTGALLRQYVLAILWFARLAIFAVAPPFFGASVNIVHAASQCAAVWAAATNALCPANVAAIFAGIAPSAALGAGTVALVLHGIRPALVGGFMRCSVPRLFLAPTCALLTTGLPCDPLCFLGTVAGTVPSPCPAARADRCLCRVCCAVLAARVCSEADGPAARCCALSNPLVAVAGAVCQEDHPATHPA